MNYKKLVLVGFISAFVAILTSVLGVTGTIIGSVISSVLYNMLSEALENPVSQATFSHDFEWEIAYVFPLVVIALIQLLLIFALLSESGFLPYTFVSVYLSIQDVANNNLYRILGLALLVMSAYPIILKPDFVKKEHGVILVFVALIFLARGFVDVGNVITDIYDGVFRYFDLPIAIVAFVLIIFVIARIVWSATKSENEFKASKIVHMEGKFNHDAVRVVSHNHSRKHNADRKRQSGYVKNQKSNKPKNNPKDIDSQKNYNIRFKSNIDDKKISSGINESSDKIQFESNDLLEDYKK